MATIRKTARGAIEVKAYASLPYEAPKEGPALMVTRTVRRGCTTAYEAWLRGVGAAAGGFPGHLGLTVLRPPAEGREYTLVFRFDTVAHLRAWEESPARQVWVARAEVLPCHSPRASVPAGSTPRSPSRRSRTATAPDAGRLAVGVGICLSAQSTFAATIWGSNVNTLRLSASMVAFTQCVFLDPKVSTRVKFATMPP